MYSSVDTIWVLLGAALVFFMQAGFAMVETGLTRAKNAGNIIMKNLMDFALGTVAFWLAGFGIMFAGDGALIGGFDPFILGDYSSTFPSWAFVIFQTVFCATAGHHRLRRDGGANQVPFLLHLQRSHKPDRLPCRRALDLGRRLAEPAGLP